MRVNDGDTVTLLRRKASSECAWRRLTRRSLASPMGSRRATRWRG